MSRSAPRTRVKGRAGHRRPLLLVFALIASALTVLTAPAAEACACGAVADPIGDEGGTVIEETAVLALIDGTETIVMGLGLDAATPGATLIMPTPTPPEVSAGEAGSLRELGRATAPREQVEYTIWDAPGLRSGLPGSGNSATPDDVGADPVQVISRQRVGEFDVAVLGGTADAVSAWLGENGFSLTPEVLSLLPAYADDGWTFTAVRYADDADVSGPEQPLRFDFASAELVYPMRLSQAAEVTQRIHLYAIGAEPMRRADAAARSQMVKVPWIGDPVREGWSWSDSTLRELTGADAAEQDPGMRGAGERGYVTEFVISGEPSSFTTDVVLEPDPEAADVIPTFTRTEVIEVLGVPVGWILVWLAWTAVLAIGLCVILASGWRREMRRRR